MNDEITLVELELHQNFDALGQPYSGTPNKDTVRKPITWLSNTVFGCHIDADQLTLEKVTQHIPKSLNGNLASPLFKGLEMGYRIWSIDISSQKDRIDQRNKTDIELVALAKQARMEYSS